MPDPKTRVQKDKSCSISTKVAKALLDPFPQADDRCRGREASPTIRATLAGGGRGTGQGHLDERRIR